MNYAPGIQYRGDQWVMQGGQQMAQIAQQLVGYMIDRGNRAKAAQGQAEGLIGPDDAPTPGANAYDPAQDLPAEGGYTPTGGAPAAAQPGGFNPVTPASGSGADSGPSPAAQRGIQAEALRKTIMAYNPGAKDVHQAIKGMSVDQLEGMLKGSAMRQGAAEQQSKMELMQAQLKDYAYQAALRKQQAIEDEASGNAITKAMSLPASATLAERLAAAAATPGYGGRIGDRVAQRVLEYGKVMAGGADGEALKPSYTEDPVTGARTLTYGKQALPTGYNPSKVPPETEHFDADGNLAGVSHFNPKTQQMEFKELKNTGLKRAIVDGQALPGFVQDAKGNLRDTRTALEKSGFAGAAAGTNGAPALKMVRDKNGKLVIQK